MKKTDGLNWTSDSSGARSAFRSEAEEWSRKAEPRIARFLPVRLVREGKNGPILRFIAGLVRDFFTRNKQFCNHCGKRIRFFDIIAGREDFLF